MIGNQEAWVVELNGWTTNKLCDLGKAIALLGLSWLSYALKKLD